VNTCWDQWEGGRGKKRILRSEEDQNPPNNVYKSGEEEGNGGVNLYVYYTYIWSYHSVLVMYTNSKSITIAC
jgi:hypothetical protein